MTEETSKKTGTGRVARIVLVVSLALNLLVVGIVAGFAFGPMRDRGHPPRIEPGGLTYIRALDPADRRAIGQAIRENRERSGPRRDVRRAQIEAMVAQLRAETIDAGGDNGPAGRAAHGIGKPPGRGPEDLAGSRDRHGSGKAPRLCRPHSDGS